MNFEFLIAIKRSCYGNDRAHRSRRFEVTHVQEAPLHRAPLLAPFAELSARRLKTTTHAKTFNEFNNKMNVSMMEFTSFYRFIRGK